jgi:hypothetical protein
MAEEEKLNNQKLWEGSAFNPSILYIQHPVSEGFRSGGAGQRTLIIIPAQPMSSTH